MKKAIAKQIEKVAGTLPLIMRNTCERHIMTGEEVIAEMAFKEIEGKPVLPSERYMIRQPVQIAINHKRAMKKLYKKHGVIGVVAYRDQAQAYAAKQNVTN